MERKKVKTLTFKKAGRSLQLTGMNLKTSKVTSKVSSGVLACHQVHAILFKKPNLPHRVPLRVSFSTNP